MSKKSSKGGKRAIHPEAPVVEERAMIAETPKAPERPRSPGDPMT
jgi:hypothetical protein